MTVQDGVSAAEDQFCVTPAAAGHEDANDRHQHVVGDRRNEFSGRRANDHTYRQRQRVGPGQKRSKLADHTCSKAEVGMLRKFGRPE